MNVFQTGIPSELIKNSNVIYKILISGAFFSSKILTDMRRSILIVCRSEKQITSPDKAVSSILLIRDMVVESWNRRFGRETIHPAKKILL